MKRRFLKRKAARNCISVTKQLNGFDSQHLLQRIQWSSGLWNLLGCNLFRKAAGETPRGTKAERNLGNTKTSLSYRHRFLFNFFYSLMLQNWCLTLQLHRWDGKIQESQCPYSGRGRTFQLCLIYCQAAQPCCRQTSPAKGAVEWKSCVHFITRGGPMVTAYPRCASAVQLGIKKKGTSLSHMQTNPPICAQSHLVNKTFIITFLTTRITFSFF